MSRSAGSNNLTDKEFNTIKILLDKGASVKEIRDCTGRSERTIRRCKNVSTPEEFRQKNKAERKARNDQEYLDRVYEAFGCEPVEDAVPFDTTPNWVIALKDIANTLVNIYNALVRLNKED